jgi:hypothetical protein
MIYGFFRYGANISLTDASAAADTAWRNQRHTRAAAAQHRHHEIHRQPGLMSFIWTELSAMRKAEPDGRHHHDHYDANQLVAHTLSFPDAAPVVPQLRQIKLTARKPRDNVLHYQQEVPHERPT